MVEVGACTHIGRVRSENQDAFGVFPEDPPDDAAPRLFIVADGMGGHADGRQASRTTVEVVRETFFDRGNGSAAQRLERGLKRANGDIYRRSHEGEVPRKGGTTGTALAWEDGELFLGHVGDSRAYRLREGQLEQLTSDHTWVAQMLREGLLSEEEARQHPRRNALTRAVGVDETVEVETRVLGEPERGDLFLLCSDGLLTVPESRIARLASRGPLQEACEKLVEAANGAGGRDNVTVMLIRFN